MSHTAAGQLFWDGRRTHGGWFRGSALLEERLVDAGLPPTPTAGGGGGFESGSLFEGWRGALWAFAALLLLALGSTLVIRRRPKPAAAR